MRKILCLINVLFLASFLNNVFSQGMTISTAAGLTNINVCSQRTYTFTVTKNSGNFQSIDEVEIDLGLGVDLSSSDFNTTTLTSSCSSCNIEQTAGSEFDAFKISNIPTSINSFDLSFSISPKCKFMDELIKGDVSSTINGEIDIKGKFSSYPDDIATVKLSFNITSSFLNFLEGSNIVNDGAIVGDFYDRSFSFVNSSLNPFSGYLTFEDVIPFGHLIEFDSPTLNYYFLDELTKVPLILDGVTEIDITNNSVTLKVENFIGKILVITEKVRVTDCGDKSSNAFQTEWKMSYGCSNTSSELCVYTEGETDADDKSSEPEFMVESLEKNYGEACYIFPSDELPRSYKITNSGSEAKNLEVFLHSDFVNSILLSNIEISFLQVFDKNGTLIDQVKAGFPLPTGAYYELIDLRESGKSSPPLTSTDYQQLKLYQLIFYNFSLLNGDFITVNYSLKQQCLSESTENNLSVILFSDGVSITASSFCDPTKKVESGNPEVRGETNLEFKLEQNVTQKKLQLGNRDNAWFGISNTSKLVLGSDNSHNPGGATRIPYDLQNMQIVVRLTLDKGLTIANEYFDPLVLKCPTIKDGLTDPLFPYPFLNSYSWYTDNSDPRLQPSEILCINSLNPLASDYGDKLKTAIKQNFYIESSSDDGEIIELEDFDYKTGSGAYGSGDTITAYFNFRPDFSIDLDPDHPLFQQQLTAEFEHFFESFTVKFKLQALCEQVEDLVVDIKQDFFIRLSDQKECDNCLIPLSREEFTTNINCPGCLFPGWEVLGFDLERKNYELADLNDDHFADIPSQMYNPSDSDVKNKVIVGDTLSGTLHTHFSGGQTNANNGCDDSKDGLDLSEIGFDFTKGQLEFRMYDFDVITDNIEVIKLEGLYYKSEDINNFLSGCTSPCDVLDPANNVGVKFSFSSLDALTYSGFSPTAGKPFSSMLLTLDANQFMNDAGISFLNRPSDFSSMDVPMFKADDEIYFNIQIKIKRNFKHPTNGENIYELVAFHYAGSDNFDQNPMIGNDISDVDLPSEICEIQEDDGGLKNKIGSTINRDQIRYRCTAFSSQFTGVNLLSSSTATVKNITFLDNINEFTFDHPLISFCDEVVIYRHEIRAAVLSDELGDEINKSPKSSSLRCFENELRTIGELDEVKMQFPDNYDVSNILLLNYNAFGNNQWDASEMNNKNGGKKYLEYPLSSAVITSTSITISPNSLVQNLTAYPDKTFDPIDPSFSPYYKDDGENKIFYVLFFLRPKDCSYLKMPEQYLLNPDDISIQSKMINMPYDPDPLYFENVDDNKIVDFSISVDGLENLYNPHPTYQLFQKDLDKPYTESGEYKTEFNLKLDRGSDADKFRTVNSTGNNFILFEPETPSFLTNIQIEGNIDDRSSTSTSVEVSGLFEYVSPLTLKNRLKSNSDIQNFTSGTSYYQLGYMGGHDKKEGTLEDVNTFISHYKNFKISMDLACDFILSDQENTTLKAKIGYGCDGYPAELADACYVQTVEIPVKKPIFVPFVNTERVPQTYECNQITSDLEFVIDMNSDKGIGEITSLEIRIPKSGHNFVIDPNEVTATLESSLSSVFHPTDNSTSSFWVFTFPKFSKDLKVTIPVDISPIEGEQLKIQFIANDRCHEVLNEIYCWKPVANNSLTINTVSIVPVSCNKIDNGSIAINVEGGSSYDYSWSNGEVTQNISYLTTGNYIVTVIDNKGCSLTQEFQVSKNTSSMEIDMSYIYPTCLSQGGIDITVTGGDELYTYLWSTGETTEDIQFEVIDNTIYNVTVTDGDGCTESRLNMHLSPDDINPIEIDGEISSTKCNMSTGSITNVVITNVAMPYTFEWSNGSLDLNIQGILAAGNYTLTVTDYNGCTFTKDFLIPSSNSILVSLGEITNETCSRSDGNLNINTNSEIGSNYFLTGSVNKSGTITSNNFLISDLPSGMYTLTITNTEGCSKEISEIEITNDLTSCIECKPDFSWELNSLSTKAKTGIKFTNLSNELESPYVTWLWNFGEAATPQTSSLSNPPIVYFQNPTPAEGSKTYSVTLTMTINNGTYSCLKTITYSVVIDAIECSLKADFTSEITPGNIVNFHDQTTTKYGSVITEWYWEFGDGSTSTGSANPIHTYSSEGVFDVKLTVSGYNLSKLCEDTKTQKIDIKKIKPHKGSSLELNPNPVSNVVNISASFNGVPSSSLISYTITNYLGITKHSFTAYNNATTQVNVIGWIPGDYTVTAICGSTTLTAKLIVQ